MTVVFFSIYRGRGFRRRDRVRGTECGIANDLDESGMQCVEYTVKGRKDDALINVQR